MGVVKTSAAPTKPEYRGMRPTLMTVWQPMAAGARAESEVGDSAVAKQLCTTLSDREFHEIPALSATARYPSRARDRSEHDSEERRRLKKRCKLDDASE